jgi:ABC-type spermidine/putrescine transport system permease subunit II
VDTTRYWYERAAHTGMAQLAELANLPMVTPHVLLGMGRMWRSGGASTEIP